MPAKEYFRKYFKFIIHKIKTEIRQKLYFPPHGGVKEEV